MDELLASKLEACPTGPGVYLMKDDKGHVLYVGKAKSLKSRVRSYFQKQAQHSAKTLRLVEQIRDIEFLRAGTEVEALLMENNLIKKWKPKYNISLKDDKTYPYLKLDLKHEFPRAYVARKQIQGDGAEYFGPFPNGWALRETYLLSTRVFLLRDCRDHEFANRSRPCLTYQIGHCTAPCVGYVTHDEYAKQVSDYRAFVKGESDALETQWQAEMEEAAEKMEYEKAGTIRDRLTAIRAVIHQEQRIVDTNDATDRDVWAVWPPLVVTSAEESGEGTPEESSDADQDNDAGQEWSLDILILQFRKGKWVGRVHRTADTAERLPTEDIMATLLLQHYTKQPPPQQILLPDGPFPDRAEFAQALAQVAKLPDGESLDVRLVSEKESWARLGELALENVKGLHTDESAIRRRAQDGLEAIARLLSLPEAPMRLECVDISNMQGEANVASCVVFKHGKPDKSEYRHYKIAGFSGQNDFASMKEVMSRRYGKPDSPVPDLLVVDGGKGQLASAVEILKSLGCTFPIAGLAKARTQRNFKSSEVESSEERLFLPGQKNAIPIKHAQAFRILTHLRDEAHRFAIEFHRLKRSQARGLE